MARNKDQLFDMDIYTDISVWTRKISVSTHLYNGTFDIKDNIPLPELESLRDDKNESKYDQLDNEIDIIKTAYEAKLAELSKAMKAVVEGMHIEYADKVSKKIKQVLK